MALYVDVVNAWTALLEQAANVSGTYTPPPDMSAMIPRAIAYAEQRIYKKLVFLATRTVNSSLTFTAGARALDLTSLIPALLVVEGVAMIAPAGTAPAAGTRWQFDPVSLDTIDFTWPVEATTLAPYLSEERGWALKDDRTLIVKPTPDQNYTAELTYQQAPTALSATNTQTYLTINYEAAFIACGMIWWAGFQRDFGAQSEDPRMAISWETQFAILEKAMIDEENRRRGLAPPDGTAGRTPSAPPVAQQGAP